MAGWLGKRLGYGIWGIVDADNPNLPPSVTATVSVSADPTDWLKAYDYDSSGNLIYEGYALPGSAKASAVWKIKKYTYMTVSNTVVKTDEQWAGGASTQVNIWNNRASLSYS